MCNPNTTARPSIIVRLLVADESATLRQLSGDNQAHFIDPETGDRIPPGQEKPWHDMLLKSANTYRLRSAWDWLDSPVWFADQLRDLPDDGMRLTIGHAQDQPSGQYWLLRLPRAIADQWDIHASLCNETAEEMLAVIAEISGPLGQLQAAGELEATDRAYLDIIREIARQRQDELAKYHRLQASRLRPREVIAGDRAEITA